MTERELFFASLDQDDPTERSSYLEQACGGDTALRERVEALLRSHSNAGEFLDVPAVDQVVGDGGGPLDFLAPSQRPGSLGRLGHYEVLEVVSRGGMGVVVRAFDDKLQRVVAIKALAPLLATNSGARQRFVREARATATVTHDNVIGIHAVEDTGPLPYLVMQFIDGPTLQQKLDCTGLLPLEDVLRIGVQIAGGLAAAHKQGLIHRDVKPANILLENGVGRVKLTDFGLARAGDDASLSHLGMVAGTPMYMSPEQARGESVDFRSDLFSLGSVLYAMCTGQPPFRAPTAVAVLRLVADTEPRPIREINPEIPEDVCAVIARLQAKDPADRVQTAAEVAELLSQHLADLRQPGSAASSGSRSQGAWQKGRSANSLSAGFVIPLSVLLVLAGGLAGYLGFRDRPVGPTGARPIRVGILHSQTGTMGSSESAAIDATLLAIEEINQGGGLLGRPLEPVVVDGMSDWPTYAREAERLIQAEGVCTIFGCWTSASRKAVTPVVEKHNHLLVYPMQYEGFEQSPHVVYTGAVPNQQVTPAVRWCCEHLGKRFFIVGSDYLWPRATAEVIRDVVSEWGGTIVGEVYLPMESAVVEAVAQEIRQAKPDVILEMVAGDSKVAYYRALRAVGITPDVVPSMSFSSQQPGLAARDIAGDYAAWNYFESIDSPTNHAFVARFRDKFGPQRVLSDPLEASYLGVHLWAQAVRAAGSDDVAAIRRALRGQRFQAPEGEVRLDPETQHLWKTPRVARITSKGTAEIVWSSSEPVRPDPFPASRTREQWQGYLVDLHQKWGEQWSAPDDAAAWERTVAKLSAAKQVEAVAQRLRKLNPGFDGHIHPIMDSGEVVGLKFLTLDVADISPVRALPKLRMLDCNVDPQWRGKLSDLTQLRGMRLEHMRCKGNPVADLGPLRGMPLEILECGWTQVSDLSPLTGMSLKNLLAQSTRVSDLTPLQGMPLVWLDIHQAREVSDLSPLKGMPLEYLNLTGLPITDLSQIAEYKSLRWLVLDEMPITDLTPLRGLSIDNLNIRATHVTDLDPIKGLPLKRLRLDYRADRAEFLRSFTSLEIINDRPADQFWKDVSEK